MRFLIVIILFVFSRSGWSQSEDQTLFMVDYGIHTAVIFPVKSISLDQLKRIGSIRDFDYLEVSIGEEPFFRRSQHSKMDIVRALFWPTESILRFHPITGDPLKHFQDVASVASMTLKGQEIERLVDFVFNSLSEKHGPDQWVEFQPDKRRYFAWARPSYHLFNNCNDWTARMFETIGIKTRLTSKFSSSDLFDDIISRSQKGVKINFSNEKYLKYLR